MRKKTVIKFLKLLFIPLLLFFLTFVYLFPLLQGLVLLPLDLLISNYTPWYQPGTILLKNPYMQDSVVQLFPWRHLVFQSLTQGIIPFWNPYQHLGLPFMANLKPMVFYPLNILFIFGEIRAWNMMLFSQVFLAMLFAYYLARDFKIKQLPSLLTSFAFGLNSYMIGLLEFGSDAHTVIWWPLLILFTKRYLEKHQGKYLFLLGITLAISIFAGHLQFLGYFMLLYSAFVFYYGRLIKAKPIVYFLITISIILGIGISAIQLFPSIELFSHSHRAMLSENQKYEIFVKELFSLDKLLRFYSPDFFGNPVTGDATHGYIEQTGYFGLVPFFFAIFAIIFARKNNLVKFLAAAFIVCLLLSLQWIGQILYFLKLPLITNGSGGRIFILILFIGAFLSGFGLSEFVEMKNKRKRYFSLLIFIVFTILSVGIYYFITKPSEGFLRNIQFASFILGIFSIGSFIYLFISSYKYEKFLKTTFVLFVLTITFFDLFRFGYRFLTFSNEKFLYPEMKVTKFIQNATEKSLSRTYGLTEPELGTYLNIYTLETYNPLYLTRTSSLTQTLQDQSTKELSIDNKYFLTSSGDDLMHTLNFVGTEYIVTTKDENPSIKYFKTDKFQSDLKKIYSDDRYSVYKNLQTFPRFGLYYQSTVVTNDKDILDLINRERINFKKNIIIEESLPITLQEGTGSAKLLSSTINSQKFIITTDKPALFYISDTFFPGWQAQVNHNPTKIYRANYNFRAVLIPKGTSTLDFTYVPLSFQSGIYVTFTSILLLLCLTFFPFKKYFKHL